MSAFVPLAAVTAIHNGVHFVNTGQELQEHATAMFTHQQDISLAFDLSRQIKSLVSGSDP